ncbi:tRNA1(Val) (adenine(37)-N6)-methyltransferase [Spiroplasma taiwanense]|uniref:Methyltransferase n=1 Tax=Spiroplasma taiwanense CT-1 TaxID=1276220 RepID=S5MAD6_9MOLU|nr:methyltransferase [Spiroplasma taiwanense]AGR40708.1 methyltransferase [Spiroplasma taiwanense CT-1]
MKIINNILNFKELKIIQDTEMFNYCIDSILLTKFWKPSKKYKNILDFGTNNAIIPLILSRYTNAKISGVEIQRQAYEIAKENIKINNLSDKIFIYCNDIKKFILNKNNEYDLIFCNPPFFKINLNSSNNLNTRSKFLISARHEKDITLSEIIESAKIALKNGGKFLLIHLSERVEEIIILLNKNNFAIKKIRFIYSKKGQAAKKVLIESINDGNKGTKILDPLYVHNEDGTYTEEVLKMFGD